MKRAKTRRTLGQQVGLFAALSDGPRWLDLPAESQRKVIDLLARILGEHRYQKAVPAAQEVEHE